MKNKLMMGFWKFIINVPPFLWEKQIDKGKKKFAAHLAFMSAEHRGSIITSCGNCPMPGSPYRLKPSHTT